MLQHSSWLILLFQSLAIHCDSHSLYAAMETKSSQFYVYLPWQFSGFAICLATDPKVEFDFSCDSHISVEAKYKTTRVLSGVSTGQ